MRVVIIAGGDFSYKGKITAEDYVICADRGYDSALEHGIKVDVLMGDMDSVKANTEAFPHSVLYPRRKDYTDTELAVRYAVSLKPDEIVLLGCFGTRTDHSIANVFLLKHLCDCGIKAHIEDENNCIYYYKNTFELVGMKGKTVSLIPLTDSIKGITTKGLDYPLQDGELAFGETKGISNVIIEDVASYTSQSGEGIIVITDGI